MAIRFLSLAAFLLFAPTPWAQNLPSLSPSAPQDKPFHWGQLEAAEKDKQLAPYISKARSTYPAAKERYLAGLPRDEHFFVVTKLTDGDGKYEQTFIAVTGISAGYVTGRIANELTLVKHLKMRDSVKFQESEVIDWLITKPDGSEEGNFVGKFIDSQQ